MKFVSVISFIWEFYNRVDSFGLGKQNVEYTLLSNVKIIHGFHFMERGKCFNLENVTEK